MNTGFRPKLRNGCGRRRKRLRSLFLLGFTTAACKTVPADSPARPPDERLVAPAGEGRCTDKGESCGFATPTEWDVQALELGRECEASEVGAVRRGLKWIDQLKSENRETLSDDSAACLSWCTYRRVETLRELESRQLAKERQRYLEFVNGQIGAPTDGVRRTVSAVMHGNRLEVTVSRSGKKNGGLGASLEVFCLWSDADAFEQIDATWEGLGSTSCHPENFKTLDERIEARAQAEGLELSPPETPACPKSWRGPASGPRESSSNLPELHRVKH